MRDLQWLAKRAFASRVYRKWYNIACDKRVNAQLAEHRITIPMWHESVSRRVAEEFCRAAAATSNPTR